jgi:MFS family permease
MGATLSMSVSYVDRQTFAVLAPQVTKALGINNTRYGWLVGAFSITYLAFTPLAGTVADRFGARRTMAVALLTWSTVAGAHALASSFAVMLVLRLLLGLTEAPTFPSAAQTVRRALPNASRPLGASLLFTGGSIGTIAAAQLAPRLEGAFGLAGAFVGTALLGLFWLPIWWFATRGHGLESGVASARASELRSPARDSAAEVSIVEVLTCPGVVRAVLAIFGIAPIVMFVNSWTAKYLVDIWHVERHHIGHLLVIPPVAFDAASVMFGWAQSRAEAKWSQTDGADRPTHTWLFVLATVLSTAIALTPLAPSAGLAMLPLAVAAFGMSGIYALVTADMLGRVPVSRASFAAGLIAAAQSIAHAISGPLVGWTVDRTRGYGVALVGLGVFAVPMSVAFLIWPVRASRSR